MIDPFYIMWSDGELQIVPYSKEEKEKLEEAEKFSKLVFLTEREYNLCKRCAEYYKNEVIEWYNTY